MQPALAIGRAVLDFALPPRCAACGMIVEEVDRFCPECWPKVDWLVEGVCDRCGVPLEGSEEGECAACMTDPPLVGRLRAATVYGEGSRDLALRLKHGRRVALARTMAQGMLRQLRNYEIEEQALLVPVPLHRWRLWRRGFNQAGLLARELSRRSGVDWSPDVLLRQKATKSLGGLSRNQRARMVAGAFEVHKHAQIEGKTIILVDDVFTTGSTIEACAKVLAKAGPANIEAVVWARVVRPRYLTL